MVSFAARQRFRVAKANLRRRRNRVGLHGTMRGVIGIGDGSGRTWAMGGPPSNDLMYVRLYRGTEADGETLSGPTLARNPSLHEFVEGDLVQLEYMSNSRGANMLTIVYREPSERPAVAPTSWTGVFAMAAEVVQDPPTLTTGFDAIKIVGSYASTFPASETVATWGARGRNAAGRPTARNIYDLTTERIAVQSGTPAFILAFTGAIVLSALAEVNDTVPVTIGAPIDDTATVTAIWQNFGNGSIVFQGTLEEWTPEAHLTYESDDDYVAAAGVGDLNFGP